MEITLKSISLLLAVLLTGLSAGLFYAWQVSVIPGTQKVADATYIESMQAINRAILNPAFYLIFFGSLIMLIVSTIQQFNSEITFWLLLLATLIYLGGTFLVTSIGNVPLNEALDTISLQEMTMESIRQARVDYEVKWNRLHLIRTVFAVISFVLSLISVFTQVN